MIYIKKFLKRNFPNFHEILFIIYNNILLKRKNVKISGWGLKTSTTIPWDSISKNRTSKGFISTKKKLDDKIKSKEFYLAQIENYYDNTNFQDVLDHYEELNYRHYVIYYSALLAFENTNSRNVVECGSAEGMSIFFCIYNFKKDGNYKVYLYDSWEMLRENELKTKEDLVRKGRYYYLNIDLIKNNLKEFKDHIIYNKGFIPKSFKTTINPDKISWLHIDLNSSMPTLESLKFFYPKLENNGVILLDDYGHDGYADSRVVIEDFFENKNIQFLQLMTGQALVVKKE